MIDKIIKEYDGKTLVKEFKGEQFHVEEHESSNMDDFQHPDHKNKFFEWIRHYWRPMMAIVYMIILILDFIVRPVVNTVYAEDFDLQATVEVVQHLDPLIQAEVIKIASRTDTWEQATSQELHYVFMILLGVSAWTRGKEKEAWANKGD